MLKTVIVSVGAALLFAAPALAQEEVCTRPTAPAAIDGSTATKEQLLAAKNAATTFIADSDTYQECLYRGVTAKREAAKAAKAKFDEQIGKDADAAVAVNQEDKQKVGADFNAAARAYKAAHPPAAPATPPAQ